MHIQVQVEVVVVHKQVLLQVKVLAQGLVQGLVLVLDQKGHFSFLIKYLLHCMLLNRILILVYKQNQANYLYLYFNQYLDCSQYGSCELRLGIQFQLKVCLYKHIMLLLFILKENMQNVQATKYHILFQMFMFYILQNFSSRSMCKILHDFLLKTLIVYFYHQMYM